jgi:heme/copper-type cytochrome/quinol oxidase subunit 1
LTGLAAILSTGDHKVIGRMYIVTSLLFGLGVVALGELFAVESTAADTLDVFKTSTVFQFFTLFRLGSVFLLGLPLVIGLAMVITPLQVGARTVAFPRAAAASYWTWLVGAGLFITSYAMNGGPGGGRSSGVNLWIVSLGLLVLAVLLAAVSLATTVIALRTPGLRLSRVPIYAWSVLVASVMWLMTLPALFGLLVVLYVDHRHGGSTVGGNAQLFARVQWVLRNPQVYTLAVPVLGLLADVVTTTAKARLSLRLAVQGAVGAFGIFGFGAFLMTSEPDALGAPVVIGLGLVAVVPVLAVALLAFDGFRQGTISVNGGLLYAVAAWLVLVLSVGAGALGSIPQMETAGTIFDLGVSHGVVLAAVIATLGGIHWWATKVGRQPANENLGRLAPLVLLLGSAAVVLPDLISGVAGKDGSAELRPDWTGGIEGLNVVVVIGTAVLAIGLLLAVVSLLPLLRSVDGDVARDPWEGQSLEWLTASPPPLANFDEPLPVVTSAEPLVDRREES